MTPDPTVSLGSVARSLAGRCVGLVALGIALALPAMAGSQGQDDDRPLPPPNTSGIMLRAPEGHDRGCCTQWRRVCVARKDGKCIRWAERCVRRQPPPCRMR